MSVCAHITRLLDRDSMLGLILTLKWDMFFIFFCVLPCTLKSCSTEGGKEGEVEILMHPNHFLPFGWVKNLQYDNRLLPNVLPATSKDTYIHTDTNTGEVRGQSLTQFPSPERGTGDRERITCLLQYHFLFQELRTHLHVAWIL